MRPIDNPGLNGQRADFERSIYERADAEDRLATPEELADMFGVTNPAEVSDTLYEDYVAWMEDPEVFAPWQEDIEESS